VGSVPVTPPVVTEIGVPVVCEVGNPVIEAETEAAVHRRPFTSIVIRPDVRVVAKAGDTTPQVATTLTGWA
jgi:hypothetical protein